jgi:glycosyltransferase 2 family protein
LIKNTIKKSFKPLLGLLILVLIIVQLDSTLLKDIIVKVDILLFLGSVTLCTIANILCALRWQKIASRFGPLLNSREFLKAYFQGVTANTVLPGGIIGGDIWRAISLGSKGFAKGKASLTVMLDRIAGFWALGIISFAALIVAFLGSNALFHVSPTLVGIYGLVLCLVAILPLLGVFFGFMAESSAVYKTALISVSSQCLFIAGFWCCLRAVGSDLDTLLLAAACAAIFLGAVVPASIGGFGSREVASIFFLGALGVSHEASFVSSVMFGLTSTIQGILFLLLFLRKSQH